MGDAASEHHGPFDRGAEHEGQGGADDADEAAAGDDADSATDDTATDDGAADDAAGE